MEKKRILVTSNHEPENVNVIWHDSNDNTFKEYSNGSWNNIGGTEQKTIEIGYFGNDPELRFQQNMYTWNCLLLESPTLLTDNFDLFKSEFIVPGISTDPEDLEAFYDFVFKYYVLPINELVKELDKGNRPIIKIIPMYGTSGGFMDYADATIITSYNIQMFITQSQITSMGFSLDEAKELLDKYKNKISMQIQYPQDRNQIVQFIKPTIILCSIMQGKESGIYPLIRLDSYGRRNFFGFTVLFPPII